MFVSTCRSLRGNVDRNMKRDHIAQSRPDVVPYVGTWIEIIKILRRSRWIFVVPYVGTWIEITPEAPTAASPVSFPTWERG